jgi:hypothetical protein
LHAAQWRVLPRVLGLPALPEPEIERGRRALRGLAADSTLGARAAWSLAADAVVRGDQPAARTWGARLRAAAVGRPPLTRLFTLLEALQVGATNPRGALAVSEPLLAHAERHRLGDPFARAALFLGRAAWLDQVGDDGAADRARLWSDNSDFEGWLTGDLQAAEVDWAVGPYVRGDRARAARGRGEREAACALLRRLLEIWSRSEPAAEPWRRRAEADAVTCHTP